MEKCDFVGFYMAFITKLQLIKERRDKICGTIERLDEIQG